MIPTLYLSNIPDKEEVNKIILKYINKENLSLKQKISFNNLIRSFFSMKLSLTLLIDIPENSLFDKNNSEEVIKFLEDTLSPKNLKLKSKK